MSKLIESIQFLVYFFDAQHMVTRKVSLTYDQVKDNPWLKDEVYCKFSLPGSDEEVIFENPNVELTPKHSVNEVQVNVNEYESLLKLFPEQYHEKLRMYTGEELFYIYKLLTFKPKQQVVKEDDGKHIKVWNSSDLFYLSLKAKVYAWLRGNKTEWQTLSKPLSPSAWLKLNGKFKKQFQGFVTQGVES